MNCKRARGKGRKSGGMPNVSLILTEMKEMGVLLVDQIYYDELDSNDSTYVFQYLIVCAYKHN